MILDLIKSGILTPPDITYQDYSMYCLHTASGVLYVTKESPHYISGHLRLLGRDNGRYPRSYKRLVTELFGSSQNMEVIELCSGQVEPGFNFYTVDINPDKHPTLVCDAQNLPKDLYNRFDRLFCDPPYNEETAERMYGTNLPNFGQLLKSGSNVVKSKSLLFFLLGNENLQSCPKTLDKIGQIFCTVIPNHEVRALHIYYKL